MRSRPPETIATANRSCTVTTLLGVALASIGAAVSLAIAPDLGGMAAAGLALVVTAIAAVDARRFVIPDELNALGIVLGLAHAGVTDPWPLEAVPYAVLRGAGLAVAFLALRAGYRRLRGRDGLGLGDVKLAAVAGVWLDWFVVPIAIDIAAVAALAAYGVRQLASGRRMRSSGMLPFGLFFAPAIWVGWVIERWLGSF